MIVLAGFIFSFSQFRARRACELGECEPSHIVTYCARVYCTYVVRVFVNPSPIDSHVSPLSFFRFRPQTIRAAIS